MFSRSEMFCRNSVFKFSIFITNNIYTMGHISARYEEIEWIIRIRFSRYGHSGMSIEMLVYFWRVYNKISSVKSYHLRFINNFLRIWIDNLSKSSI